MDATFLLAFLALMTLTAGALFGLWSKTRTEQRRQNPNAPKSTLAKDAASKTKDGKGAP